VLRERRNLFISLFVASDAVVIAGACYAAWGLRRGVFGEGFAPGWDEIIKQPLALFAVPVGLYALSACGLYRPRRDRSIAGEMFGVVKACVATVAVLVLALWAVGFEGIAGGGEGGGAQGSLLGRSVEIGPERFQVGAAAALMAVGLCLERASLRMVLRAIRRRGWNRRSCCIVGVGRLAQVTARAIERNAWTGLDIAYFVAHDAGDGRERCLGRPVLGSADELEQVLEKHPVDAVYLALPQRQADRLPDLLRRLDRFAVEVRIVPEVMPRYLPSHSMVGELDGMPVLAYRETPADGLGGLLKRALDLLGATAALILFSPVMLVVAGLVALSGPGPIIFRQRRVSLGGSEFWIYKFRTMHHVADEREELRWTRRDDPRVTPIGRWLRRTSLDELPQLFNVLRGEMSLVGPRPERPEFIERFRDDWRGYVIRHHVKAGMTGWAQVNGLRGDTSLRKRLQYDLFYIRHWSVGFDLKILWLTLFRGFLNRNAH